MSKPLIIFCLLVLLLTPALAFAADYGLEETAKEAGLEGALKTTPEALIGRIIKTALTIVGVIFFGLMLYGGFLWMTARGETKIVEKAKDTLWAAGIGLVIISAAYAITFFVIESLTK